MSDANALVKQAVDAYKAQDKIKAKDLLLKAVDVDANNEQAWMWMSAVVDSLEEQQVCLENALRLNPNNERAKKGLEVVAQKLGTTAKPTSTAPDPIPSSVDWGNANAPAAYGSGQQVELPNPQQLDNWIDGLGIGGKSPASSPAATSDDPWASLSAPSASDDPWASLPDTGGLGTSSDIDSLWATPAATPAAPSPPNPTAPPTSEAPADPWATIDTGGGTVDPAKPNIWDEPAPATASVNPFTTVDWDKSEVDNYDPFRAPDPWESKAAAPSTPNAAATNDPFRTGADAWGTPAAGSSPASADPFGAASSAPVESWGNVNNASPSSSYSQPAATPSYYEDEEEDYQSSGSFDFDDDSSAASGSYSSGGNYSSSSYGSSFDFGSDDGELFGDDDLSDIDDFDELSDDDDPSRFYAYIPNELHEVPEKGSSAGMLLMLLLLIVLNIAAGAGLAMA